MAPLKKLHGKTLPCVEDTWESTPEAPTRPVSSSTNITVPPSMETRTGDFILPAGVYQGVTQQGMPCFPPEDALSKLDKQKQQEADAWAFAERFKAQDAKVAPEADDSISFESALTKLINSHSKENDSNTPDYILA